MFLVFVADSPDDIVLSLSSVCHRHIIHPLECGISGAAGGPRRDGIGYILHFGVSSSVLRLRLPLLSFFVLFDTTIFIYLFGCDFALPSLFFPHESPFSSRWLLMNFRLCLFSVVLSLGPFRFRCCCCYAVWQLRDRWDLGLANCVCSFSFDSVLSFRPSILPKPFCRSKYMVMTPI